ncbi:Arrestin (or S-antigen), C-terminal domain [Popillia japonica]|uniref:Arrestin (Or S-antigen), C-terminal domain n=1 Tax=Popillia japonica TaxID=7064 RepID=A0AAW1IY78_POPJA
MADIENKSNADIRLVECKIDQKITYYSDYPARHSKELASPLCSKRLPRIAAHSIQSIDEQIEVPKMPVVNFTNCHLFEVRQSLNIKIYIEGCHRNLTANIPITLGNFPIRSENYSEIPVPIMASLGTPYPYEMEQVSNVNESGPIYSAQCNQYGWWLK